MMSGTGPPFVLSAPLVRQMIRERGLVDAWALARQLVAEIDVFAHPLISEYHVGAVAIGCPDKEGDCAMYCGVNLEFPPLPINGETVHAEQFAAALAFLHGEPQLTAMVTAAGFPCGHCRQFLSEIAGIDRAVFLAASDETVSNTMQQLLPGGMRPAALEKGLAPVLGDGDGDVAPGRSLFDSCCEPYPEIAQHQLQPPVLVTDSAAAGTAAAACVRSWAPYTSAKAGVALLLSIGEGEHEEQVCCCPGSAIESVAFNPSLPPLQVALIAAVATLAGHRERFSTTTDRPSPTGVEQTGTALFSSAAITAAVLVEEPGHTSWAERTAQLLRVLAPSAPLHCYTVQQTRHASI